MYVLTWKRILRPCPKNNIFHLSFCSVFHGYYKIYLLVNEAVKYWRQNFNIEGKNLMEFPMAAVRVLFTEGAAISNLITRCVQNSVFPNVSGM